MSPEERIALVCSERHPLAAAQHLERFSPQTVARTIDSWPSTVAAAVLRYFLAPESAEVLRALAPAIAVPILMDFSTPLRLAVLRQMPQEAHESLIEPLEALLGTGLREALAFPEDTAGSLVDPLVFTAAPDWLASATLQRLKTTRRHVMYYIYAIDRDGRLAGVLTLKQLIAAQPERPVSALMLPAPRMLPAEAREAVVRRHPYWVDHPILPVVDRNGRFIGALRYRTLKEQSEATAARHQSTPLSESLMALWELYARTCLGVMTNVATVIQSGRQRDDRLPGGDQ